MNRGQRTVASLLAVVAVLLGLNLVVRSAPPAWAQEQVGPTQATVVAGQIFGPYQSGQQFRFFRFWSDGAVDTSVRRLVPEDDGCDLVPSEGCGPAVVLPGTCTADANRNGEVEVNDLLTLLGEWGPCE